MGMTRFMLNSDKINRKIIFANRIESTSYQISKHLHDDRSLISSNGTNTKPTV
jgi:hypothetical protein